ITATSLPAGSEASRAGARSLARAREARPMLPDVSSASATSAGGGSSGRADAPAGMSAIAQAATVAGQAIGRIALSGKRLVRVRTFVPTVSSGRDGLWLGCGWQATMARPPRPDAGIGGERMPKAHQAPIAGPGWGRDGSIARPFGTDQ